MVLEKKAVGLCQILFQQIKTALITLNKTHIILSLFKLFSLRYYDFLSFVVNSYLLNVNRFESAIKIQPTF